MKKKEGGQNLSNVFSEIEKIDLTGKELDDQLIEFGFNPDVLVKKVRERINKFNESSLNENQQPPREEFNPFLLAAGKSKGKKPPRRAKKND